jgi:hypothetical protein
MRNTRMMLPLALLLCATGAFAAQTAAVTIPFSFESHGKLFSASQYIVTLSDDRQRISIASRQKPGKSLLLLAGPANIDAYAPALSIKFDAVRGLHELRSIRVGSYQYMR